MKENAIAELVGALQSDRPVVLFLGQAYGKTANNSDPVLSAFLHRVLNNSADGAKWSDVFGDRSLSEGDYEWLSERFDRNIQSEAIEQLLEVAWSAVFTSSVDQKIVARLETRGRVPEVILAQDHFARVPRSKARPAVHYLFGRANEAKNAYRPPHSKVELKQRSAIHSRPILNRIGETATPLGLVVIDGYEVGGDWLDIDELLAPLSTAPGPRVLWFGAPIDASCSVFISHMEKEGLLLRTPKRLADAIVEAEIHSKSTGTIFQSESGTVSLPDGRFIQLSPSLRLRVEAAGAVVDDTWTDPPAPLVGMELEESFQRFHGDLGGPKAIVEGISRGYAIERDFEHNLLIQVEMTLKKMSDLESFVVLHGQSGVGKSIGLARLAREIRTKLKLPVLFSWGRIPAAAELDELCGECERAGANGTVIICDGNHSYERYRELSNGLKSRGRRIVVVGSSYRIEDPALLADDRFVTAPEMLSAKEASNLRPLLTQFSGVSNEDIKSISGGANVLAMLYRYLSVSRSRLATGVSGEARYVEGKIRLRARQVPKSIQTKSALAQKLIDAGLGKDTGPLFEEDENAAEDGADAAAKLIDYVMTVGRLDCAIPVNLLIRALREDHEAFDPTQIGYLFGELDLFRWKMGDAEGNDLLIQPRLQLEAELVCKRRMADPEKEINCILNLIEAVRPTSVDRKSEQQFLLDLLHKLHRDGPRGAAYKAGYLRIGRALTNIREQHHVKDASVMLQESAFRRAALFAAEKPDDQVQAISDQLRDQILNEAREVVELAIKEIGEGHLRAGRRSRQNFVVERASIYGFLAVGMAKRGAQEEDVWPQYLAARSALSQAMSASDNYFSMDIGIWTPADIISFGHLSTEHKAELQADILAILDQANADLLPALAAERFHSRRLKVAPIVNDLDMAEEAFKALEKLNAPVAYFLRARALCPKIFQETVEPFSVDARKEAAIAADFLENRRLSISSDTRCLQLLLQLKWIISTGHRALRSERCVIPGSSAARSNILKIVSTLNEAAGEGARNVNRLLEASLEWLHGDTALARELFQSLSRDSEFEDSSRVVRRLVFVDPAEKGFIGRIEKQRSEGHWSLSVDGFSGTIDLLSREFSGEDLRVGREVRNFNIAFNYLGPIADPILRRGARS